MGFTWYTTLSLIGAIACFIIASFTYVKVKDNKIHFWYPIGVFGIALWTFDTFYVTFFDVEFVNETILIHKFLYLGAILSQATFIKWAQANKLQRTRREDLIVKSIVAAWIGMILIVFSNNFANPITKQHFYGQFFEPGHLYKYFVGLLAITVFYGLSLLFKQMKKSQGQKKTQLKYIILISLANYTAGAVYFLYVYNFRVYPIADLFVVISCGLMSYAIIRHRLMDIEIIVKRTLVFTGLFAVSYAIFASFTYLGTIFFEHIIHNRWMAMIPSIFLIVLTLRPLESFLRSVTDKYLFQKKYDYKHLIRTITDEVIKVLDLNDLINLTVNKLTEIIKLENASIFLYNENKQKFDLSAFTANNKKGLSKIQFQKNDDIIYYFENMGEYLFVNDSNVEDLVLNDLQIKKMKALKIDLLLPLMSMGKVIGILVLGEKKSDEIFSQEDIDTLQPLSKTLSVAISNARLFEQLSQAQAQAAQREKMAVIGTLSAGINHEICNPLGIARGQCEMFLLNQKEGMYDDIPSEELLKKANEIMKKVIIETDRATLITRKLSSFAKPAKGEKSDDVSVNHELETSISLVEHELKLDNVEIICTFRKDIPDIEADPKQLQEIFFNLIRNAAQAIKDEGKIMIDTGYDRKNVYVYIEDTGEGMGKGLSEQIFNPFFTTKDPGSGTGLGLFIVKQVIEKNNGKIKVNSEKDKGTVFVLSFPHAEKYTNNKKNKLAPEKESSEHDVLN